jgi:hypothetical protein
MIGGMNMKNKFAVSAVSLAVILLMSGAAFGDELVQLGPFGGRSSVSFIKRDPEKKSVVVKGDRQVDRQGVATSVRPEQAPVKRVLKTKSVGNGITVTYYAEER